MRACRCRDRVLLALVGLLTASLVNAPEALAQLPTPPLPFVAVTPCRVVDTRGNGFTDPFGPPALASGVPRDFPLAGQCGIPADAKAVSLNVTATNTLGPGFLLLAPAGSPPPLMSTLNYLAGDTVANAALAPLGPGGLTVVAGVSGRTWCSTSTATWPPASRSASPVVRWPTSAPPRPSTARSWGEEAASASRSRCSR